MTAVVIDVNVAIKMFNVLIEINGLMDLDLDVLDLDVPSGKSQCLQKRKAGQCLAIPRGHPF